MKTINRIHTFLAVIISLQVLFWSIGGFFMYYFDFSDLYTSAPPPVLKMSDYKLGYEQLEKLARLTVIVPTCSGYCEVAFQTSAKKYLHRLCGTVGRARDFYPRKG